MLTIKKLIELARRINEINPRRREEVGTSGSDVFEI